MLVLFTCCWGSDLSIQAEVGKLNGDLLQLSRIRYEVWSFSVRYLISIACWKWLISRVKPFVVVPRAIGISLHNRIGDSVGEFLVVVLWEFLLEFNDFTWLVYIIESPDRNIGIWHDSITLQMLPGINIGLQYIKYTSEYILKLQIHDQQYSPPLFDLKHLMGWLHFFSTNALNSLNLSKIWILFFNKYTKENL